MITRRSFCWSLAALPTALLAGGCAPGQDAPGGARRRLANPVTVKHRFGSTTVHTVPRRIVTVDLQWTDTILAMGVKPVGYTVDELMPNATVPWQRGLLPESSKALSLNGGLPVEQILALNPDLVLASFSIDNESTYRLLSDRVPTIAGPPDVTGVLPWQELVGTAGKFLNQQQRAQRVIGATENAVEQTARDLRGLQGKTFALAQYQVGRSLVVVADEQDGSSVFFRQLGMRLYPPVRAAAGAGQSRLIVSTERADLLRADLLAFLVNGGDESALADIPGFDRLPGTVALLDYPTVVGLNTPTSISTRYALDKLRPFLEKAA